MKERAKKNEKKKKNNSRCKQRAIVLYTCAKQHSVEEKKKYIYIYIIYKWPFFYRKWILYRPKQGTYTSTQLTYFVRCSGESLLMPRVSGSIVRHPIKRFYSELCSMFLFVYVIPLEIISSMCVSCRSHFRPTKKKKNLPHLKGNSRTMIDVDRC